MWRVRTEQTCSWSSQLCEVFSFSPMSTFRRWQLGVKKQPTHVVSVCNINIECVYMHVLTHAVFQTLVGTFESFPSSRYLWTQSRLPTPTSPCCECTSSLSGHFEIEAAVIFRTFWCFLILIQHKSLSMTHAVDEETSKFKKMLPHPQVLQTREDI